MTVAELRAWLLEHNRTQSVLFRSPDAKGQRLQYRARHPTEVLALKCMDGRLHLPVMTKTPLGIVQPMRNLGGVFDLGWPFLGEVVTDWVRYAMGKGRDCIILVTYHWSAGEAHRGCRGFNYDVEAARAYTEGVAQQIERMFGHGHATVYPVRVGVETDLDALVFHGANGRTLDIGTISECAPQSLRSSLEALYPDMKPQMLDDLLPFVLGNIEHVTEIRASHRPLAEAEHRERVLGVGRGFDWLHLPNLALLVGPFDPILAKPVKTAAGLLHGNITDGRVPDDGIVLLASAPYREEAGYDVPRATEKARYLSRMTLDVIRDEVPELRERVVPLTGIVNMHTREFTEV